MADDYLLNYQIAVHGECDDSIHHARFVHRTLQELTRNIRTQFRVSIIIPGGTNVGKHAIGWAETHQFQCSFVPAPLWMARWQMRQVCSMLVDSYSAVVFLMPNRPQHEIFRRIANEMSVNLRLIHVPEDFDKLEHNSYR